jgi:Rps23 Pro-64 3,4-dihydroxylase Tpa1-like proline 4-hydroxylase
MNAVVELEADYDRLKREGSRREEYRNAEPFPHIAIDNFIRPEVMGEVYAELTSDAPKAWDDMNDRYQRKSACSRTRLMGPKTRALIHFLNGQEMIEFLEELTGIEGLVPDPSLAGGGLHELRDGGYLNVHADFNFQRKLRLDRRINLLLYFNKDWREEYGGNLELWDTEMKSCVKRYTPEFNRCVIFSTTDKSYHGNPQPVKTPDGRTRRSIAMYYYTNGRPAGEVSDEHMTLFQYRPGEASAADTGRRLLKRWLPPALSDLLGGGKVR